MLLEAAHICKRFGARPPVLTDVTFGLEAGEFVSVIGPAVAFLNSLDVTEPSVLQPRKV